MSSSEEDEYDPAEQEESGEEEEESGEEEEESEEDDFDEAQEDSEEEDGEAGEDEWTDDHLKLLYLISKYAEQSADEDTDETWIRKNSLLVLMYEVTSLAQSCSCLRCVDKRLALDWSFSDRLWRDYRAL